MFSSLFEVCLCICHLLPFAIRVEGYTVDWAEVTFDPAKLLLIGRVEEPRGRVGGVGSETNISEHVLTSPLRPCTNMF